MGISVKNHKVAFTSTVSESNWNFKMLGFMERGKREYPGKNSWSKDENQQHSVAPRFKPGPHRCGQVLSPLHHSCFPTYYGQEFKGCMD